MIYIAIVYKVLQSCDARRLAGDFYSQIISQAQFLHVTKLSPWFAQVHSVQNNISKSAMHKLICIIA